MSSLNESKQTFGASAASSDQAGVLGRALYPNAYTWFVFFAALDVMFTTMVLYLGGIEVNGVANLLIESHGVRGMVILKFSAVVLVVAICQWIGLRDRRLGRRVALAGVALNVLPVVVASVQLLAHSAAVLGEIKSV